MTNSVASISAQDLEERSVNRIENALSGQMAGVYAQTTSSEPGVELSIRVRGTEDLTYNISTSSPRRFVVVWSRQSMGYFSCGVGGLTAF